MRVFILALGTRGDFEPFWCLGRNLRLRGHHVTIGTSAFHIQAAADPDLAWVRIGAGTRDALIDVLHSLALLPSHQARTAAFLEAWIVPQLRDGKPATVATAAAHDYFVSNIELPLQRAGVSYPGAFVSYDPPALLSDLPAPASRSYASRKLELVAMSRALVDPEMHWGVQFQFTGFWRSPPRQHEPPALLAGFMDAGPAPMVLTMGSMVTFDAAHLADCFARALAAGNRRGVIIGGWSDAPPQLHRDGPLLITDQADYDWLFPRAAGIIHHGGTGTVAAALRAGVPSILLPQIESQDTWGALLTKVGVCAGVLDTDLLDPQVLAAAIDRIHTDQSLRDVASAWPAILAADGGVEKAVALIEAHWSSL